MWYPPEMIEAFQAQGLDTTASGTQGSWIQGSGSLDPTWNIWQGLMKDYAESNNSAGLPKLNFWLVISLPGESFSDTLVWHEEIPMLVPSSGTGALLGLAQTRSELDKMMQEDAQGTGGKTGNVHLTYKVKIQGQKAWRDLLDFLAEHDMLEHEGL